MPLGRSLPTAVGLARNPSVRAACREVYQPSGKTPAGRTHAQKPLRLLGVLDRIHGTVHKCGF